MAEDLKDIEPEPEESEEISSEEAKTVIGGVTLQKQIFNPPPPVIEEPK